MKYPFIPVLLLLSLLPLHAAEEIVDSNAGIEKVLRVSAFNKWDFLKAVRALGTPPGPVSMETYNMLRSTWDRKTYAERSDRQHALIKEMLKNGTTTDMNTWMMIRADAIWLNHSCSADRKLFYAHLLKPYAQETPKELPNHRKWIAAFAYHDDYPTEYLMGIVEAQCGRNPFYTETGNIIFGKQKTAAEVNRLWSDPVAHTPYLMWHGSDFARHTLRFLLHDSSAIYESARRSGLTCWNYTWGKDLPEPIALGLQLMQKRSDGKLPSEEELSAIRSAAQGLPTEMQGFIVRNMLAADPSCMPWKKLNDPSATPAEMPDCSAVNTAQWSNELLGQTQGIESDLAALEALVVQEQEADMLSSLVLFTLADGARTRKEHDFRQEIPAQGHYRYSSTFDVEVSENGIDVLIDEKGPRFSRNDEEMRQRCRQLNVALHRCALQLALLERDGKTEELQKHCRTLAEMMNRHRIWPLLLNQAALRGIAPECRVQLMHHCKGGTNILESMAGIFAGGRPDNIYSWANLITTRRDEDNNPAPEPEVLASVLRDYLRNSGILPCTGQQLEETQKRWLELDDRFPRRGLAEALLIPGRMNDTMYRPEIAPARLTGENNRRGYFFIRHALRKGDIATAEKMLAAMTEDPKMYRHTGIRLAAALVARAKGNEAAAREHERLGITQAAMQQYSYYTYHWTDAHRLLLEHGLTHASERLMLLIPERDLSYTRPALAQKLAEQRKFRSAAFAMEVLLAKFCSNAVPVSGLGTQEDLISWRLQADVYHALALLQQGNKAAADTLLHASMAQLERMPRAAAMVAPALLCCADIPAETRRDYHQRLLNGAAACPDALERLQQTELCDLPTADESAERTALQQINNPEGLKPLVSPFYTWHLQKQDVKDEEREKDERTATRVTVDARILSTSYANPGQAPWVELETESGRKLKVNFDDLEADDLANIIDWKERNNIRTWTYREAPNNTPRAPFDARLDRMLQGKSGGIHKRWGVDVSDGRQVEFTLTNGAYYKLYVNELNDEEVAVIEQCPIKQNMEPHLHRSFSEAEADAKRRNVSLRVFMLGKPGGPEEEAFRRELKNNGIQLQEYNSLLVCYKKENGEWDENGRRAMELLSAAKDAYSTPDGKLPDGGFFFYVSPFTRTLPFISLYQYTEDAGKDADYKALLGAIRRGNRMEAERLLDARPDLVKAHSGITGSSSALSAAITCKKPEMAELLLQRGANPNERNSDGHTMLMQAVCSNVPETVRVLLKHGARHDIPSKIMMNPPQLPFFTCANKPEVLKVLLEAGVDPNLRDTNGNTLPFTILNNSLNLKTDVLMNMVRILVAAGYDINSTDNMGCSILYHVAKCAKGNASWEPSNVPPLLNAMKELIDLGAAPEETSRNRPLLLDRINGCYNPRIVPGNCPEVDKILREYRKRP